LIHTLHFLGGWAKVELGADSAGAASTCAWGFRELVYGTPAAAKEKTLKQESVTWQKKLLPDFSLV